MWKWYVWKREPKEKKDGTLYKDYSIMPANIVAW